MSPSDSDPVKINLFNHVHGDTWGGVDIGPVMIDGGDDPDYPMPLPIVRADLHFVKKGTDTVFITFSTEPAVEGETIYPITIVSAENWEIKIESVDADAFNLPPGTYIGHFTTTDSADVVRTLYELTLVVTKKR